MHTHNLVWMDLEMTGLDPNTDQIIEMATVITDPELNIVARGPELVISCGQERLEAMDEWNRNHHKSSGLWDLCLESSRTTQQAEEQTLAFLKEHTVALQSPLCGNSIWQDRRFLVRHMPLIDQFLHYRLVDVSTIKELAKRWYPSLPPFNKKAGHRAMQDIEESIAELKYSRQSVFKGQTP